MPNHSHDLYDFMNQISQEIASEYNRIQKNAVDDPGTAGDQGEENWATILREWLPSTYQIVTKGRIISHNGEISPQIDILVLKESYPKKLLDKKLYLSAGIAAAFECKNTLKAKDIEKTIKNSTIIKALYPERKGTPYKELHSPIVYGLLAHSHSWKNKQSTPIENIESCLIKEDYKQITHPRQMIDLLCVADLGTWVTSKMTFLGPLQIPTYSEEFKKLYGANGSATTGYIRHTYNKEQTDNFTPIGALISYLSQKLAWENIEFRDLADYYSLTNISGNGAGQMRTWNSTIYSEEIRIKIEQGHLSNGKSWDEWSIHF
jgi:hypothetical protein